MPGKTPFWCFAETILVDPVCMHNWPRRAKGTSSNQANQANYYRSFQSLPQHNCLSDSPVYQPNCDLLSATSDVYHFDSSPPTVAPSAASMLESQSQTTILSNIYELLSRERLEKQQFYQENLENQQKILRSLQDVKALLNCQQQKELEVVSTSRQLQQSNSIPVLKRGNFSANQPQTSVPLL